MSNFQPNRRNVLRVMGGLLSAQDIALELGISVRAVQIRSANCRARGRPVGKRVGGALIFHRSDIKLLDRFGAKRTKRAARIKRGRQ